MVADDQLNEVRGASKTPAHRLHNKCELADALRVSPRTVENWQSNRRIPYIKLSPRLIRFDLERVLAALKKFEIREVA